MASGGEINIRRACISQNVPQDELYACVDFVQWLAARELQKQKKCPTESDCFAIVRRSDWTVPPFKEWVNHFARRFASQSQARRDEQDKSLGPTSLFVTIETYRKNDSWQLKLRDFILTAQGWALHTPYVPCFLVRVERKGLPTTVFEIDDATIMENLELGLDERWATTAHQHIPISTDVTRMTLLGKHGEPVNDCFAHRRSLDVIGVLPGWAEAVEDCRRKAPDPLDCGEELEKLGNPSRVWRGVPLKRW